MEHTDKKFRSNLLKNIPGAFFGWLFYIVFFIAGIYDVVKPFILENEEIYVGIILTLIGAFLPTLWAKYILKWDNEMEKDFVAFCYTTFFGLVIFAAIMLLEEIYFVLLVTPLYCGVLMIIGIINIIVARIMAPRKNKKGIYKARFAAFSLVMGNIYFLTGTFFLIGGNIL